MVGGSLLMIDNLNEYINLLKKEQYYDAHEILEEVWFPRRFEENDEVKLLKGFINASVCFELHKKGRMEPSKKVWNNYLKYRPLLNNIESEYKEKYFKMAEFVEGLKEELSKH